MSRPRDRARLGAPVALAGATYFPVERQREHLTPVQRRTLAVIETSIAVRGYAPTVREIGAALGVSSTNAVSETIGRLVRRGVVHHDVYRRNRAIVVCGEDCPVCLPRAEG